MNKKTINIIITILSVVILLNLFVVFKYVYHSKKSEEQFDELREVVKTEVSEEKAIENPHNEQLERDIEKTDKVNELFSQNEDMVGWIEIEDTKIDYPVMNSEEYLYKDFYKKHSKHGTPFVNREIVYDDYTNIITVQAHNMKDGSMFSALREYLNDEYLYNSKPIKFYVKDKVYTYDIYGVMILDIRDIKNAEFYETSIIKDDKTFLDFASDIDDNIAYKKDDILKYQDDLIFLSTCLNSDDNKRIVLVGHTKE